MLGKKYTLLSQFLHHVKYDVDSVLEWQDVGDLWADMAVYAGQVDDRIGSELEEQFFGGLDLDTELVLA